VTLNGADTDYQYTAVVDGPLGTWNLSSSHFTSYSLHPNVTYRLEVNDGNTSIYAYRTARLYFATNLTGLWTKFSKDSGGIPLIDFHYRFSMLSDYTLDIVMIPGDVVVRTYHGTGMELREAWDGRDMAGMPLMDGQYEGRLRAEEKESGSGVQIVLHPETLFWDTAGPTVSFVTPIDGSTVHDSVSVGVVVWDAVSSNLTVDLFYGSGSTPGDDDYIMIDNQTWDTNYVPNGSYTLKAVATDQAGNSTTALIHVEVENLLDITEFSISEQIIDPHMNTTITWWVIPTGGASVQVKLVHICQYTKTQTEIRSWDFPNCPPGASTQVWDGTKEDDSIAPPGEYRVVIEASSGAITCTLGNTPDLPGTVPFTTTAAGGSGTRGGMNFTGPGSFKLQMILQAKGVLFITPVAAFSGAGSISQASPRYGAASKYSSEHASEKVALPASEREIEFMNLDGQGRILVSKAGAGGERSKNIDPETGQSRYLPSATPSTESGAPCAGLYQGQAGFKTSDANPTFVPPGGLGWVSINMSASTIDRNAIWLKGERTDILIDVFPKVLTARYNAVCNITLKSSSSNEVEADLKVLAGKIYTSQQSAIADGDPPVVRTLLTGHAIQPGGQVEVLWDTKDDEGRILRQGLYVIMLVLKKDGYECRVFRKIIVH
jgi:flagellar hook assembly protein FlgD